MLEAIFTIYLKYFVNNNITEIFFHLFFTAGKLLQNIDTEIDPCDNFFEFACGGWLKRTVIPEDRSSYSSFTVLREEVQVVLKGT